MQTTCRQAEPKWETVHGIPFAHVPNPSTQVQCGGCVLKSARSIKPVLIGVQTATQANGGQRPRQGE